MHYYCPSCPAKITYEAVKPTKCPKCGVVFASAFKGATAAPVAPVYQESLDDPRPRYPKTQSTTVAKPRFRNGEWVAPVQGRLNDEAAAAAPDDPDTEDEDYIDPRSKRRLKQELLAMLDPNDIHVNDEDERPPTFADLWNTQGARKAREESTQ